MEITNYEERDEQQIIAMRENAQRQLAAIKTIDEGAEYLSKVKALEAYARATKQDAEIVLMVQEQKLRSMRILGKLLEETELNGRGGGNTGKNQHGQYEPSNKEVPASPRLADLGITKNESSAYQTISAIPEEEFNKQIEQIRQKDDTVSELSVSRFIQTGKPYKQMQKISDKAADEWPKEEREMLEYVKQGRTVVINMNRHFHLFKWATENGKYERVDRFTDWGNPFEMGKDGTRDEVCNAYQDHFFPYKKSLHPQIGKLRGKVLGCHCHPQRCHGHFLAQKADGHE